jgi:flagellar hook-length control protein FliK
MPTPVKNVFPVPAAPAPVKAGRGASVEGAGESFQNELVRRRGGDRAKAEAAKSPPAKSEAKRSAKARKASRGGRGETRPAAEEPDVRAEGPDGAAPAGAVEAEAETVETDDSRPPEDAAKVEPDAEESDPSDAAAVAPLVAAGVSAPDNDTGAPAEAGEGEGQIGPDAEAVASGHVPARPVVYHASGAEDLADAGDATGAVDAVPAAAGDGAEGLFAGEPDGASEEGSTSDEQSGTSREHARASQSGTSDVPAGDEAPAAAGLERHTAAAGPRSHDVANGDAFGPGAAVTAGDLKPEVRPLHAAPPAGPGAPPVAPEVRFAAANHETIVTSMRGELMPQGGTMRIRLDPPQLGALQVTVQIQDGVVTASFETSNDEATRLLGHSLNQLKTVLESHGVAVDKLQVQQAPREAQTNQPHDDGRREQGSPSQEQEQQARQEQQRREMLKRMWRRLSGGADPLDLTA